MKEVLVCRSAHLLLVVGIGVTLVHNASYSYSERDYILKHAEESRDKHVREYMSKIRAGAQPKKAVVPAQSVRTTSTVSTQPHPFKIFVPKPNMQVPRIGWGQGGFMQDNADRDVQLSKSLDQEIASQE